MRPISTTVALMVLAAVLAVCDFHKLALVPALAALPLVAIIFRVVLRLRRQRRTRQARSVIDQAITIGEAMREGLIAAHSVIKTVQGARSEIAHAGAAEARAVLDALERQAREHPEGVPGPIVAEARLRFDELVRSNIQ